MYERYRAQRLEKSNNLHELQYRVHEIITNRMLVIQNSINVKMFACGCIKNIVFNYVEATLCD